MTMRIGLNLLHAMPEIGGGWNYIANLLDALGNYDSEDHFVAFVTEKSEPIVPNKDNFECVKIKIDPRSRISRVAYENTILPRQVAKHRLDCLHWFANVASPLTTVPAVVTVYDLKEYRNPKSFRLVKRVYLRSMFNVTARKANVLLPISQATADDIVRFLAVRASLVVIPVSIGAHFRPVPSGDTLRFREKYNLPPSFWLYVAHTYPHKNHLRLLNAYYRVKVDGLAQWPLVLRGDARSAEQAIENEIQRLKLEDDVIRLPRLDYGQLPYLYSAASALIFPSLFEGGGIPVVEAMACGCSVVVSDLPVTREFAGDAALRFDGTKVEDIYNAMVRLQTDRHLRAELSRLGIERAKAFSAPVIADRLRKAYRLAANISD